MFDLEFKRRKLVFGLREVLFVRFGRVFELFDLGVDLRGRRALIAPDRKAEFVFDGDENCLEIRVETVDIVL